jgi:parallel beta-helix repeat protein
VAAGIYNEHVELNMALNLVGEDKATTIITADGTGTALSIQADWVNVSGFTFRDSGSFNGIGPFDAGLNLTHSHYCRIWDCNFINNTAGLGLYESGHNVIRDCYFTLNEEGIHSAGIEGYLCPLPAEFNEYNEIYENIIMNNGNGISLGHSALSMNYANVIRNNNISENDGFGLRMIMASQNEIYFNEFYNNTGPGVNKATCMCGGEWNEIHHNAFFYNNGSGVQGSDSNGSMPMVDYWYSQLESEGNYWSDYSGTDSNGDGIGEMPYDIASGDHQDLYPFTEPHNWSDGLPPATPENVKVVQGSIRITWDAGWNGNHNPVFYRVYWSTDEGAAWPWNTGPAWEGISGLSFTDPLHTWDDGISYYYIVRSYDLFDGENPTNSSCASKVELGFTYVGGNNNIHWVSIPHDSVYQQASDITDALTDTLISEVYIWNDATNQYDKRYYSFGSWQGTNFNINPGDSVAMTIKTDFDLVVNGSHEPGSSISYTFVGGNNNIHWVSVPYNSKYSTASDITDDLTDTLISEVYIWNDATNAYDKRYYSFGSWQGTNFNIAPGDGVAMTIKTDFDWTMEACGIPAGKQQNTKEITPK